MAKKIIAFIGSPRRNSNTEILVDEIIKGAASQGSDAEKIILNEKNIKLCQGLEDCRRTGECPIKDDAKELFDKIRLADVIILASPNYWASYTAQLKIFLDRWGVFFSDKFESRISGKKFFLVAVCGNPDIKHADFVLEDLKKSIIALKPEIIGELKASANNKASLNEQPEKLAEAFNLGVKLK